jgi:hypothetical protein
VITSAVSVPGRQWNVPYVQPTLPLWEPDASDHLSRVVASASDRVAWLRARAWGVTATDAARFASMRAVQSVAMDKLLGTGFGGNDYTEHGRAREPEIARWVQREHDILPNDLLFHAAEEKRHLATPDGVAVIDGRVTLAEIKTTAFSWRSIPRSYLRQVWWQQYVLGAERTLVVWEQHVDFVPIDGEPRCQWVDRDENEIHILVTYANHMLALMKR